MYFALIIILILYSTDNQKQCDMFFHYSKYG